MQRSNDRLDLVLYDWDFDWNALSSDELDGDDAEFGAYRNVVGVNKETNRTWRARFPRRPHWGHDYFQEIVCVDPPLLQTRYGKQCILDAGTGEILLERRSDRREFEPGRVPGESLWYQGQQLIVPGGVMLLRAPIEKAVRCPNGYIVVQFKSGIPQCEAFDAHLRSIWTLNQDWIVDIPSVQPLLVQTGDHLLTMDLESGAILASLFTK